jgi:peptide/nickel transport system substrate-binding protein
MRKAGAWTRTASRIVLPLLPLLPLCGCGAEGQGGRGAATIFYASGADLQSINPLITVHPLAKQVQQHVLFLTLAAYDSALRPVPRLASWTWEGGRRTLRFALRHDVSWHDRVPTTAADAAWTLERARDPAVAYPRARDLADVERIETPDSFTLVVRFRAAQPVFPDVFTDLAVLPAHRFAGVAPAGIRSAPFNAAPVGNGRFQFVEHRPNQRWVFRRNPAFPADLGPARFERLVVVVVDEPTTKLAALTSGELHFAGITAAHADFVRRDPRLAVVDYPLLLHYGAVFNLRRPPFDDARVRRALSRAVDRPLIVEAYIYGFGQAAAGPVSPAHPWYDPVPDIPYDPAGAARLLDEAGWRPGSDGVRTRNGRRLSFAILTVGSGDMALEQMLQAQWRAVGADVTIRQMDLAAFLDLAQGPSRDFDVLITGIPGDLALSHVAALYDGDGPLAYPGFHSVPLARAFERVRHAAGEAVLAEAWRDVQRELARDEPTAWIYHARGVQGKAKIIETPPIDLRGELAGISAWRVRDGAPTAHPPKRPTAGVAGGRAP